MQHGWRSKAKCLGEPTFIWFTREPALEQAALAHCALCPVLIECGSHASAYRERDGIWAGLRAYVEEERQILWGLDPTPIPGIEPPTSEGI